MINKRKISTATQTENDHWWHILIYISQILISRKILVYITRIVKYKNLIKT
jgi:hypothetical protein